MKFLKSLIAATALAAASASMATPISGSSLQSVLTGLHTAPGGTGSTNAVSDQAGEVGLFTTFASGGSLSTMIIELAGFQANNTFGIYDPYNIGTKLELFSGPQGSNAQAFITQSVNGSGVDFVKNFGAASAFFSSNVFGYYLAGPGGTFYSQSSLNGGGDYMIGYKGDGVEKIKVGTAPANVWGVDSWVLAWEDLSATNADYDDMVVFVDNIRAVPEPASLALLGLGLAGVAAAARRKAKKS